MKADIKAQWVKDLRSGEFEQGHGLLERVDSDGKSTFCCLGVLCRQAVKAGAIPAPELHCYQYMYLADRPGGGEGFVESTSLPRKVREWAGLPEREDIDIDGHITAIHANDALKLSFAEIADLIEQNVPAE